MRADHEISTIIPESVLPKPEAVILDMDGTLIDVRPVMHHVLNGNHNVDAFVADTEFCPAMPEAVEFCAEHFSAGRLILVVTARTPRWRTLTVRELHRHLPYPYRGPYMRGTDDKRHDVLVKLDMYKNLSENYDIVGAIDDHPGVVDLWNDLGIPDVRMTSFTTYDDTYRKAAYEARSGLALPSRSVLE